MDHEDPKTDAQHSDTRDAGRFDPRDTDHPVGSAQAAENTENESPA